MIDSPRRGFLKVAGAGIAAAGVAAAAAPAVLSRASGTTAAQKALPSSASGAMVAYISDVHGGEVSVMVEGREVVITDHELVSRLAHAIHTA